MAPQKNLGPTIYWLGETVGFWVQTGAFFLTALAGIFALVYSARQVKHIVEQQKLTIQQLELSKQQLESNERLSKVRATVDVVMHESTDADYQACLKGYALLRKDNVSLAKYACDEAIDHAEQNDYILPVLNKYEFMSAGIRSGAFDELIYRKMKRSTLIRDWEALSGYVHQLRAARKNQALFVEFESLAKKWIKDPPNIAD